MKISFDNLRQAEGVLDNLSAIKEKIEHRINLSAAASKEKNVILTGNKIMRLCLIVGLAQNETRDLSCLSEIQLSKSSIRVPSSFFTYLELKDTYGALLKYRYRDLEVDWSDSPTVSRIIASEMYRGRDYLMKDDNLDKFLLHDSRNGNRDVDSIPALMLAIGEYEGEIEAKLDINSKSIPNTQILIAGSTGSGKTNLIAVIVNQLRILSVETPFPVQFLLFDYKGDFSDTSNNHWLNLMEVDRSCILDPMVKPLPFSPFKDFTNRPINEVNLYSSEMASALSSIDRVSASSTMTNHLSEAIVDSYIETNGAPINFELMLMHYQGKLKNPDQDDTISSVLKQLVRANLFEKQDNIDLIKDSYIIKMDGYPKDGPIAKAIVYFTVSKINNIYEKLDQQAISKDYVQIRHYTIIDEAHYMLDFDNRPLRNLIAVGRNKGLSIILATQNMSSYKSKHFDFYANAQYPLIMKQQTIDDRVIKDLFGVNGNELQEIRQAIAGLQKGELIIKNNDALELGLGKKYKKIKVTHLI